MKKLKKFNESTSIFEKLLIAVLALFAVRKGFQIVNNLILYGFLFIIFIIAVIYLMAN